MYCISIGQIPGQIPTRDEVWRNVKCQKWGGGGCIWFIDLNSLVRGGNSSNFWHIWFFLKTIWPKILHCAIECVTLCWSASEGLSPQLGKEASLLPSNTIHTLLTLPPTVLSPPVHSHPDTSSPPTTLLHGWTCLVLRSMHVCCLPWQTPPIESLFSFPPRAAEARRRPGCTTIRKWPHLQRKSDELRLAGRSAHTLLSVVWISVFWETLLIWNSLLHKHKTYTYREGILCH